MCLRSMADGNCGQLTRLNAQPSLASSLAALPESLLAKSVMAKFAWSGPKKRHPSIFLHLRPRPAHRLTWAFAYRQVGKEKGEAGAAVAGSHTAVYMNASTIFLHDAVADP